MCLLFVYQCTKSAEQREHDIKAADAASVARLVRSCNSARFVGCVCVTLDDVILPVFAIQVEAGLGEVRWPAVSLSFLFLFLLL